MTEDWISRFGDELGYGILYEFLEAAHRIDIAGIGASLGLTSRESLAVYAYSLGSRNGTSPFSMVNGSLRTGSPSGVFVESLIADLRSGLPKLQRFHGIVYRKVTLPAEISRNCSVGTIYCDKAFLSASTDPNIFEGRDMMLISASSGVMMSPLSAIPFEQEVLFSPETAFRIDRIEQVGQELLLELSELSHG